MGLEQTGEPPRDAKRLADPEPFAQPNATRPAVSGTVALALYLPDLSGGGAERMMVNLARGIAERGVGVEIVLANRVGPFLRDVPPSVPVIDLESKGVMASLPGLVRYLRSQRPQALLATLDHANAVAVGAARLAGTRTRVFVRQANVIEASSGGGIRRSAIRLAVRLAYPRADGVVAVSEGISEGLVRDVGVRSDKVHTIYNPVVSAELDALAQEPLEHPWFLPGAAPVVLAAGRLTEQKDFSTLIDAFSRLRSERHVRLVILGEGEERSSLSSRARDLDIEDAIDMPGFVDNPFKYMSRASLFVLSSRWEGLPGVLVQALACGCPVVSTDCAGNGPREILRGGEFGSLVPVGDSRALATAMDAALEAHHDTRRLRERAMDFTVERAVDGYLGFMLPEHAP